MAALFFQPAKGVDLGHVAVLIGDMPNHIFPAELTHIDIDIGVLGTVRIVTFEQQAIFNRAGVGQTKHIPHHGANARTPSI